MADKFEELRNILIGDEVKRVDTKFMEFGDKLKRVSETAGVQEISKMEEKLAKLQRDVKSGFDKMIDTINVQFKKMESNISKNSKDIEAMRKKFSAFRELFSDR